jgi:hypothetical protein
MIGFIQIEEAMEQDIFLTEKQVDELTGISRGCTLHRGTRMERKITKYDRQVSHLRSTGVTFFVNARGRPIIVRSSIEGAAPSRVQTTRRWTPEMVGSEA